MRKRTIWILAAAVAVLLATYGVVVWAGGTENDPLVSLSYLTEVFRPTLKSELKTELAEELGAADTEPPEATTPAEGAGAYVVVELAAGQTLTATGSAEIILRSGSAKLVVPATAGGGLANLTNGSDQGDGETMEKNHLYLVPRADGRGLLAEGRCFVMVRGAYEVK